MSKKMLMVDADAALDARRALAIFKAEFRDRERRDRMDAVLRALTPQSESETGEAIEITEDNWAYIAADLAVERNGLSSEVKRLRDMPNDSQAVDAAMVAFDKAFTYTNEPIHRDGAADALRAALDTVKRKA